jgi:hypothetical protein
MSGWPWPLNAVQGWFDGLWSWISEAAKSAVSVVSGWINDGLEWLWKQVQNVGTWIVDSAKDVIKKIGDSITTVGKSVSDWITNGVKSIGTAISDAGAWLYENVTKVISDVGTALSKAAGDISNWITNGIDAIGKGLVDLGGSIVDTLTGAVDGVIKWAQDGLSWLGEQLTALGSNVINAVGGALETVGSAIVSGIGGVIGPITEGLKSVFDVLGGLGRGFDPSGLVADAMAALQSIFATFTKALSTHSIRSPEEAYAITWDTINQVTAAYMTQTISLIIAEAVSIGQIDISPQGLAHTPQMESALSTVQTLYATMADISLVRPLQYFFNQAFTPEIPPTVDLIRFVVREVITPAKFYEYMPWKGFSNEWAIAYWEAHWVLPDPSRLIDAYHRKVITKPELDKYIVWHDFKPEPRPGISKSDLAIYAGTLKTLIPRVDIRYAWETGLVSDEELVAWYEYLGYEEDAGLMADIQKVRAMVEEINKVRNEDLSDFVAGYLDEATLRANLGALGISEQRIEYYVAYAQKRRARNQKKELLDIYQDGYVNDLVKDEELEAYAEDLIDDVDARDLFMQRAYVRKYKKPAPPKAEAVKVATLTTLAALYRAGSLTEEAFRAELSARNYAPDQIDLIVKAEDLKIAAAAGVAA